MKRCPKCDATYADETLNFCLEDGEWLVDDTGEPATAILHTTDTSNDMPTRAQLSMTDATAILSNSSQSSAAVTGNRNKWLIAAALGMVLIGGFAAGAFFLSSRNSSNQIES